MSVEDLKVAVTALWPSYGGRTNVGPMYHSKISQFADDEVNRVLKEHRAQFPDETKPNWKLIYAALGGGALFKDRAKIHVLLAGVRDDLKRWSKRWRHMSDDEVFQHYLDAQTYTILKDSQGRMRDDPGRKWARSAAVTRWNMAKYYRDDLEKREEEIPAFLELGPWPGPPMEQNGDPTDARTN